METSAPNMGEGRAALESGMDRASTDRGPRQAKASQGSTSSIRDVLHRIVQRRMEAARLLLANRTNSVTDISLSLGYAQINLFSSAFREATGWTPTVYRREFE